MKLYLIRECSDEFGPSSFEFTHSIYPNLEDAATASLKLVGERPSTYGDLDVCQTIEEWEFGADRGQVVAWCQRDRTGTRVLLLNEELARYEAGQLTVAEAQLAFEIIDEVAKDPGHDDVERICLGWPFVGSPIWFCKRGGIITTDERNAYSGPYGDLAYALAEKLVQMWHERQAALDTSKVW